VRPLYPVIALRPAAGRPGLIEIDGGDDGSADISFARQSIETIRSAPATTLCASMTRTGHSRTG
jgi:hypothetical protein